MTAIMIKMDNGFFIPELKGFDDTKQDTLLVDINLAKDEADLLSYKELRDIGIMERYYDKLKHQVEYNQDINELQNEFRIKNNIDTTVNLSAFFKEI